MACPHATFGDPTQCSRCIGAEPRVVTQAGRNLLIDGAPAGRPIEPVAVSMRTTRSQRKGGVRRGQQRRSKP